MLRWFPLLLVTLGLGGCRSGAWAVLSNHATARFGVLAQGFLWTHVNETTPEGLHEVRVVPSISTGWQRRVELMPLPAPRPHEGGWQAHYALVAKGEASREIEVAQLEPPKPHAGDTPQAVRLAHCQAGDYGLKVGVWDDEEENPSPVWEAYFSPESGEPLECPRS